MANIERSSLKTLTVAERSEVDEALRAPLNPGDVPSGPAGFLPDNNDIVALWLFLLMAGAGGIGVYFFAGLPVPYAREAALGCGVALIAWTTMTWVTTYKKRGCLFTTFGTFRLRGEKLKGVRHADVQAIKARRIGGRGKRFTVFELVAADKKKLTLYAHGGWADAAIASIQRVRGGNVPVAEY